MNTAESEQFSKVFNRKLDSELSQYIGENGELGKAPDSHLEFLLMLSGYHPSRDNMEKVHLSLEEMQNSEEDEVVKKAMEKWSSLVWFFDDAAQKKVLIHAKPVVKNFLDALADSDDHVRTNSVKILFTLDILTRSKDSPAVLAYQELHKVLLFELYHSPKNFKSGSLYRLYEYYCVITDFLENTSSMLQIKET